MDGKKVLKTVTLVLCCAALAVFSGCGSSVQPIPPNIIVTVSPTSASVAVNQSQQFTATVQNDTLNRGVRWQVFNSGNSICDTIQCGSIDQTGRYTAPATVPTNPDFAKITIGAASVSDPSLLPAFALVTILPASAVAVQISPMTTSVQVGGVTQFTAAVQNDPSNKGVTWSISSEPSIPCTGSDCGTINATGRYTASSTVNDAPGLLITATSVADPSKSGNAVVFVVPAPTGVAVFPSNATIQASAAQQFTATGDPFGTVPMVTWSLSGVGCTGSACGTIDPTGLYLAPAIIPNPSAVTVKATSVADTSIFGSAAANLGPNPNNSKLNGQYAFQLNGIDGDGPFAMAGSVTADGNGNITTGVADINLSSSIAVIVGAPLTGSYSVGPDNRGSMTVTTMFPGSPFSQTFSFALGSLESGVATRGQMAEIDGEEMWSGGALAKQDATAFSAGAVTGNYAFAFKGTDSVGGGLSAVGRFSAGGNVITAGQTDVITTDPIVNGTTVTFQQTYLPKLPFVGIYNVGANGRGTATFDFTGTAPDFSVFSFYVISASELFVIEIDQCPGSSCSLKGGIIGTALQQSAGTFTANSLAGPEVLTISDDLVKNDLGVSFATFDGIGNMTGASDKVDDNVVSTVPVSGTYTVDSSGLGRGVLTFASDQSPRPFYLVNAGNAFILDSINGQSGTIAPQSGGPFNNGTLAGNYVLDTSTPASFGPGSGVLASDGTGNLSGTADAHDGNGSGTGQNFTGNYSVAANGRGTLFTTTNTGVALNWILYVVSPSKILIRQVGGDGAQATIQK
jgi:hypothetical protein